MPAIESPQDLLQPLTFGGQLDGMGQMEVGGSRAVAIICSLF